MQNEKLHQAVAALKKEIEQAGLASGPAYDRLTALLADIERQIEDPEDEAQKEGLLDNMRDSIGHLEVEHPRVTSALIQIMTSLGGAGI
ncbi:MAG: DUF4404 family protein [Planctomycetes bacterium]|nr:DUF4404 family protein [Planctomycetota bacterium]HPF13777.1 DUF4404 family protein [Planctomycetota bacterium]HRV79889.1 DUF4404 family protein [Planctomycetota bacterium]